MFKGEKSTRTGAVPSGFLLDRWEERINRQATARPQRWLLLVVFVAVIISLYTKFPVYADATKPPATTFVTFPRTPYGAVVAWWLDHPFRPVPAESFFPPESRQDAAFAGTISHYDKLTFRAVLPLLNGVFHGGFWTLVGANHAAVLASYVLLYVVARRQTGDPVIATLFVWAYAAAWAGGWGFHDMVYGDAVAIAFMLGALAVRRSWAVACLIIVAGFTDERAVLAAPLLGLFRWWAVRQPLAPGDSASGVGHGRIWGPVAWGMGGYAVLRLFISLAWGVSSGTSMLGGKEIFLYHCFVSFPVKIFGVFEFLWIFPLGLLAVLLGTPAARRQGLLLAAALGGAFVPALMVWDIERSLCYLVPGVLLSVCFFPANPVTLRRLLWAATAAGVVWFQVSGSILRYLLF